MNTTDSAVRITHLPTGIVVSCQNEKSQIQNRAAALRVLQSRLLLVRKEEEKAEMDALKGDTAGSWGNQMRSYVLHPYQMVKDLRTEHETGNTSAVLDGEIDDFIEAGIRWRRQAAVGAGSTRIRSLGTLCDTLITNTHCDHPNGRQPGLIHVRDVFTDGVQGITGQKCD